VACRDDGAAVDDRAEDRAVGNGNGGFLQQATRYSRRCR
jgi:hypothetical protein